MSGKKLIRGPESLLSGHSGVIALIIALGWATYLLGRQAIPPLLPNLMADLSISSTRAGFALTVMMGSYGLMQYPAGRVSDDLSRRTALSASLIMLASGDALLMTSRTYERFLLSTVIIGVGGAFYFTPSRALLSDLFDKNRGLAFGLQTTAGMSGSALASFVVIVALQLATWRSAFLLPIILLLTTLALFNYFSLEQYVFRRVYLDIRQTGVRLAFQPSIRELVLVRVLVGFVFQGVTGFLPVMLQTDKHLSPATAGVLFALVFVTGAIVGPVAGRISDSRAISSVMLGALLLSAFGLFILISTTAILFLAAGVVVMSAGLIATFPVVGAALMNHFPDESRGGDLGAVKTIYTGGGSLGPVSFGIMAGHTNYTAVFAGGIALLVLAGATILWK